MLHPDMSAQLAQAHRDDLLREAHNARRSSGAVRHPARWRRALQLRTGVALVTLGTRMEVRALRAGRPHQAIDLRRMRPVLASERIAEWL
jgi:hypothetical protein